MRLFYQLFCIVFSFTFFSFSSCKKKEKVVAQVYNEYLYESDVQDIIPKNSTPEDSATLASYYIEQWIKDAVVLCKAKENVNQNFDKQLRDYKNSLIIYEYERIIIEQELDTNVNIKEVQDYYNSFSGNFILKDNILKVLYVKFKKGEKDINKVQQILFKPSLNDNEVTLLQNMVSNNAVNHFLDKNKWITFQELQREIPIETYNEKLFLQNNKNVTIQDNNYIYLAKILDFKIKESISPLNFEKERIKEIILNKRKVDLIEKKLFQLTEEAEINNQIKIN